MTAPKLRRFSKFVMAALATFLAAAAPIYADTVTPTWYYQDSTGHDIGSKRITITPIAKITAGATNFITGTPIPGWTTNGVFTTNLLNGAAYRVEVAGYDTYTITNWFSTNVTGAVNARDYTTISTNLGGGIYAYSQAAADAKFALKGSGGITNTFANSTDSAGVLATNGSSVTVGTNLTTYALKADATNIANTIYSNNASGYQTAAQATTIANAQIGAAGLVTNGSAIPIAVGPSGGLLEFVGGKMQVENILSGGTLAINNGKIYAGSGTLYADYATTSTNAINGLTNGGTVVYTSWLCTNEFTSIELGSSLGTSAPQNGLLQRIFDLATNGPLTVYVDGHYSTSLLKVRSNTRIVANPNCGFASYSNSLTPALVNFNYTNSSMIDSNIVIDGLTINGNGTNQSVANITNGLAGYNGYAGWIVGCLFAGVKNLSINNTRIFLPKTFALFAFNGDTATIKNSEVDIGNSGNFNMDGYHFCGPYTNIVIDTVKMRTKDDSIAFNADDTIAPGTGSGDPAYTNGNPNIVYGPIFNVRVANVFLNNGVGGSAGIRLQSGSHRIDGVSISHIYGSTWDKVINIGGYETANGNAALNGPGHYGNITIEDVDVAMIGNDYYGDIQFFLSDWTNGAAATVDSVTLKGIKRRYQTATKWGGQPSDPLIWMRGGHYKYFSLDGIIYAPTNTGTYGCAMYMDSGYIDTFAINNSYFSSNSSTNNAAYSSVIAGYPNNGQYITNMVGGNNTVIGFTNLVAGNGQLGLYPSNTLVSYAFATTPTNPLTFFSIDHHLKTIISTNLSVSFTQTADGSTNVTSLTLTNFSGTNVTVVNPSSATAVSTLGLDANGKISTNVAAAASSSYPVITNMYFANAWNNNTATVSNTPVSITLTNAGYYTISAHVDAQNTTAGEGSCVGLAYSTFKKDIGCAGVWQCSYSSPANQFMFASTSANTNTPVGHDGSSRYTTSTTGQYATWELSPFTIQVTNTTVVTIVLSEQNHTSGQIGLVYALIMAQQQ